MFTLFARLYGQELTISYDELYADTKRQCYYRKSGACDGVVLKIEILVNDIQPEFGPAIPLDSEEGKKIVNKVKKGLCHGRVVCNGHNSNLQADQDKVFEGNAVIMYR